MGESSKSGTRFPVDLKAERALLPLTFPCWILSCSRMRTCFDCSNSPAPPPPPLTPCSGFARDICAAQFSLSDQLPCYSPPCASSQELPSAFKKIPCIWTEEAKFSEWIFLPACLYLVFVITLPARSSFCLLFFHPPQKTPLTPFSTYLPSPYIVAPFDSSPGECHLICRWCKMCLNGL